MMCDQLIIELSDARWPIWPRLLGELNKAWWRREVVLRHFRPFLPNFLFTQAYAESIEAVGSYWNDACLLSIVTLIKKDQDGGLVMCGVLVYALVLSCFVLLRDVLRLRHFRPMGAEQSCCQGAGPSHAPEVVQAQNVQPVQFSKTKCLAGAPWAPASENDDEQNLQTAQSLSERTPTVLIAESNGSSSRQVPAVPAGSSFGIEKIEKMNHLEVDQDILRGIALHRILREYELWKSPEAVRQGNRAEKVWALSREVAAIDTFISHSWRTKGRWKVLSLLMQSGWPHAFVGWFLGVAIALSLTATEVLDPPLEATINVAGTIQTVPFGPWTLIFGCVMMLVGFLASPFLPCQDRLCFLDVACIHQGDTELLERGIYGIGGFLSVSRELRVLYSRPYLSSLWCILFARRYAVYISIPYALCDLMCLYILYFIQDK